MSWASHFPEELTEKPVGLVALTGLDAERNQAHKAVLEAFSQHRKPDRLPLRFVRFPVDHEYPKSKPKRTSYEWYIPKGLLKSNWLRKHLCQVPSVVVVFFDLDWDDAQFREKQLECASRVRVVRECLTVRLTQVVVVLLQRKPPLPLEEDLSAKERAPSLCSACDLNPNHLFVLVQTEHLYGYIIRLESAFFDLSQNYYHQQARKVKSHRDNLNKISHQLLFVRHQFKIGVYNELKQDPAAALKHYKECYNHILELRLHEKHVLETKMVAGFVNYKICKLLFHKNAMDAIKQFKAFTEFFKDRVGMMELAFEHYSWLSKQNEMFGELFNEAVKMGLSAVQMQHPGIYFQEAAKHAIMRKNHSQKLCRFLDLGDKPNPLADLHSLDFYGQRPWRQGNQSFDPPDYTKERNGIQALQNEELKVNLSAHIIGLLGHAVRYFKKYKSPRTKQQLYVQMSEEHYSAKQYSECLSCVLTVLDDYRREGWWAILTSILQLCLSCSFMLAAPQAYVHACLELMNNCALVPELERLRIQHSLLQLVRTGVPAPPPAAAADEDDDDDGDPGADADAAVANRQPEDYGDVLEAWRRGNLGEILVDMDKLAPFLSCKVAFASRQYEACQPVRLHVHLLASCVQEIQFSQLSVTFTNSAYNAACCLTDQSQLFLQPNRIARFAFDLAPQASDVGAEICVAGVTLTLSGAGLSVRLRWRAEPQASGVDNPFHPAAAAADPLPRDWREVRRCVSTRIVPKPAQLSVNVSHESPALANEFYRVTLSLRNSEPAPVRNCRLSLALLPAAAAAAAAPAAAGRRPDKLDPAVGKGFHMSCDSPTSSDSPVDRIVDLDLGEIGVAASVSKNFFLQIMQPGDKEIGITVAYETDVSVLGQTITCAASMSDSFTVCCIVPLEVLPEVQSMSFAPLSTITVNDPFILSATTRSQSPWPIELAGSDVKLNHHVHLADGDSEQSQISGLTAKESECVTECRVLSADSARSQSVKLGSYHIRWRRAPVGDEDDTAPFVTTSFALPTVGIQQLPLMVTLRLPSLGVVYEPIELAYRLENRTAYPQEVQFGVARTDAFMFAGMKSMHFRILPQSARSIEFCAYPLVTGRVELPSISIKLDGADFPAYSLLKDLHSHLFVKPPGKGTEAAVNGVKSLVDV